MHEIEELVEVLVTKGLGFERYKNPLNRGCSTEIVIAPKTVTRRKAYGFGRAS
jgi:hypothetical protein